MLKWFFYCLLLATINPTLAKPILTVYTCDSFSSEWGPGPVIKKEFEKECNCELKFVALKDSVALLNRLRLEGKNSRADIVIGLDNNLLQIVRNDDLFISHNITTRNLILPGGWDNSLFLPYDYSYFAFIYDKTKLKKPPLSLHELIDDYESLKIIYEDPRTSSPGLGLLLWIQKIYGNDAPVAWKKLAAKTVTVTRSWSEAYGLFLKGEADMVLSYITSPAYHIVTEKKNQYASAMFREGHYQQIEVAGQLASSKQPALAHRFMQFILTPAFQQAIPTRNWMYPVIGIILPSGFTPLPAQILSFTPRQIAIGRTDWINRWQQAISD